MTHRLDTTTTRSRSRSIATSLALVAAGTFIGVSTQQFAAADLSAGDRPVLVPIEPCRLADTRPGENQVGPRAVPLGAGDVHTVDAQEAGTPCSGKIPTDATALSLNVTALGATELSFLTIWAGGDRPLAASLNPAPGQPPVPNAVTTQLSVDQEFEIYNNAGNVNVVIDANGYYVNHNHDDRYSRLGHGHDGDYSAVDHSHASNITTASDHAAVTQTISMAQSGAPVEMFRLPAPAASAGTMLVTTDYRFDFDTEGTVAFCSVWQDDTEIPESRRHVSSGVGAAQTSVEFSVLSIVPVAAASDPTFFLRCEREAGASSVAVSRPGITAVFIPA